MITPSFRTPTLSGNSVLEEQEHKIVSMKNLFGEYVLVLDRWEAQQKEERNQRGKRLKTIKEKTGYSYGFIGKKLKGLQDIPTLDYIISVCKDAELTGSKNGFKHAFDVEILKVWNNKYI